VHSHEDNFLFTDKLNSKNISLPIESANILSLVIQIFCIDKRIKFTLRHFRIILYISHCAACYVIIINHIRLSQISVRIRTSNEEIKEKFF
jgi:hypothetical protein